METKRQNKWLIAILSVVLILCTALSIAFISHNTTKTAYGSTYSFSYSVSDDEWTGTNLKSYSVGDVVNFSFTNDGPMTEITIKVSDRGTDTDSTESFMVKKGTKNYSYTFKHDGGKILLQTEFVEIYDDTPLSVTFDLNNGSSTSSISDITGKWNGASITLPSQQTYGITRTGYTFLGWALTNDATSALSYYNIAYTDATDGVITLYAVWEEVTGYTVTYNSNGATSGTAPTDSTKYASGASVTLAENTGSLTKTGYKFLGWNTDKDATTALTSYKIGSANVTFYAVWKETYTISYDGNAWTGDTSVAFKSGDTLTVNFTSDIVINDNNYMALSGEPYNYTFQNSYCLILTNGNELTIVDCQVSVIYDKNGGTCDDSIDDANTYDVGGQVTLKEATNLKKVGYIFLGWALINNATTALSDYTIKKSDVAKTTYNLAEIYAVKFYAVWGKLYSVTYDENGGSVTAPTESNQYTVGGEITLASYDGKIGGYTFAGWNTDKNATTGNTGSYTIQQSDIVSDSITFYAVWKEKEPQSYTYTWNGSTWNNAVEDSYYKGDTITITTTNFKSAMFIVNGTNGPTFNLGSKTYTVVVGGATVALTNDGTIGRAIISDGYKLFYDGNTTDTTFVPETSYYASNSKTFFDEYSDEIIIIKENPATIEGGAREGYSFLYWNTKADGSGTKYYVGDTLNITEETTLYAFWEKVEGGDYLKLTAKGGAVKVNFRYFSGTNVCYSLNGGSSWTQTIAKEDNIINLSENESVCFKGMNIVMNDESFDYGFKMSTENNGTVEASGDITSLINGKGGNVALATKNCFLGMFIYCDLLTKAPNLPSTKLISYCYRSMFGYCTNLKTAPTLPATTLEEECYASMFDSSGLETAPALPATTLAFSCYNAMFMWCESLKTAPALPATTLADRCYQSMFCCCTSLKEAPALPATTLTELCYECMFSGCTSLEKAPALNATTLAKRCYAQMFQGTSLKKTPDLSAKVMAEECYYGMFMDCTKLTTPADILHVETLADYCFSIMYSGCTNLKLYKDYSTEHSEPWITPDITETTGWNYLMFYNCGATNYCDTNNGGTDVAKNTTYYLECKVYSVTYDDNVDSEEITVPTDSNSYFEDDSVTVSTDTPTRTGYNFLGWNTDKTATTAEEFTDGKYTIGTNNVTFYAIWINYTVTYNVNGGSVSAPTDSNHYCVGGDITLPSYNGERSGYTFVGWSTDKNANTGNTGSYTILQSDIVSSSLTYYAIWNEIDLKIATVSLTLENNLKMNYKVNKDILCINYTNPYIVFSLNGVETTVTDFVVDGSYLVFEFANIEGKFIGDTITATLKATRGGVTVTGKTSDFDSYSIKEYCETLISKYATVEKIRTLCVDILNYGSACQIYYSYKTSELASKDLTNEQNGWATESRKYVDSLDKTNSMSTDKNTCIAGAGMLLGNAINMQIAVYSTDITGLTMEFYNGSTKIGETISITEDLETKVNPYDKKTYYLVDFVGLNACELSDVITIKVFRSGVADAICSVEYSMESYAYAKHDIEHQAGTKTSDVENLEQLISAVMKYGDSARAYKNK